LLQSKVEQQVLSVGRASATKSGGKEMLIGFLVRMAALGNLLSADLLIAVNHAVVA